MSHYQKQDPKTIEKMFGKIAPQYDKTNALLSFQLHRWWNSRLIRHFSQTFDGTTYLDLCAGTGEIAYGFLKKQKLPLTAHLLDFSAPMLDVAKSKAKQIPFLAQHTLNYVQADAEQLPFDAETIDGVTIAYGLRNIKDPLRCSQEVFRILRQGKTFAILELTEPDNRFLKWGHNLYLKYCLPRLGKWFASDKEAYSYLSTSVRTFVPPEKWQKLLEDVGFFNIKCYPLNGGIATLMIAKKP